MANLNLGQDVANTRERKTAANIVAKSYSLEQAVGMHRYGSLININTSGSKACLAWIIMHVDSLLCMNALKSWRRKAFVNIES